jgi:hypothetical protein
MLTSAPAAGQHALLAFDGPLAVSPPSQLERLGTGKDTALYNKARSFAVA